MFTTVHISEVNQLPGIFEFALAPLYHNWIKVQGIEYKTYINKKKSDDGYFIMTYIIEFYNDEDAIAFKLRWV